jgi:hypothetical protein
MKRIIVHCSAVSRHLLLPSSGSNSKCKLSLPRAGFLHRLFAPEYLAVSSSETSVDKYPFTRHCFPEDITLHSHGCQNLKSNIIVSVPSNPISIFVRSSCD